MAQTPYIFDDQYDVADFLREGDNSRIADYLEAHQTKMASYFFNVLGERINFQDLPDALRSQNDDAIDACRRFIEDCLDQNIDDLPIGESEQTPTNTPILLKRISTVGEALRSKLTLRNFGAGLALSVAGLVGGNYFMDTPENSTRTSALQSIVQANFNLATTAIDIGERTLPDLLQNSQNIRSALSLRFEEANQAYQLSQNAILDHYPGSYYNPFLVRQLETDENAQQYIAWITQAALDYGLDPVRFANQMHRESRQFDPQIVSGRERSSAGALGLAQFMPSTASNDYGLTEEDLRDPQTAIFGAAYMMAELMSEYNGDQALAEIAYNGGRGAVQFVQEELGRDQITSNDWVTFMQQRRIDNPTNSSGAWQNQTYAYVRYMDGSGWELPHRQWSRQQQSDGLPNHMMYVGTTIAAHHGNFNNLQVMAMASLQENSAHLYEGINASEVRLLALHPQPPINSPDFS